MSSLRAIFWKGLGTLVPITVTVYALYWAVVSVERLLRPLVPDGWYFPGSGLLVSIALILVFGTLMHLFLFERLVHLGTAVLSRIPVVKSVYSALQDFFAYLGKRSTGDMSRVVAVKLGDQCRLIGFVTNPTFDLPNAGNGANAGDGATAASGLTSVYLPMSYQIGGFMVLLPVDRLEPLDISAEDAMRLVLTAGVRQAEGASAVRSQSDG